LPSDEKSWEYPRHQTKENRTKPFCRAKSTVASAHLCQKRGSCIPVSLAPYHSISVTRCLVQALELVRHLHELTQLTKTEETNPAETWIIFSTFLGCIGSPKRPAKAGKSNGAEK